MTPTWIDPRQWVPLYAPIRGTPVTRTAALYTDIAKQFDVLNAQRYQPVRDGIKLRTWCKTFAWDVCSALGVEAAVAHWVRKDDGSPYIPVPNFARETNANETFDRLRDPRWGWRQLAPDAAYARADLGFPTVAAGKNPSGPGHIAVVLPGRVVAGAGARCVWQAPISASFGALAHSFFTHD